jgi:hypothetical protein
VTWGLGESAKAALPIVTVPFSPLPCLGAGGDIKIKSVPDQTVVRMCADVDQSVRRAAFEV